MRIVIPADRPRYDIPMNDDVILTLSPIIKTDKELFEEGVEELSLESRFSRFGQGVSSLSEQELDYLTDVDQLSHVAWGAAVGEEAAGVGRYIVVGDGTTAEVAVTVLDTMQRRGIGSALFAALVAVARADGIHEFAFEARADNEAVMELIRGFEIAPLVSDGIVERRIRLSAIPTTPDDDALVAVIDEVRRSRGF